MEVRPLPLVDKLLQGMLQVLEDRRVGTLYLVMVYGDTGLELLCHR